MYVQYRVKLFFSLGRAVSGFTLRSVVVVVRPNNTLCFKVGGTKKHPVLQSSPILPIEIENTSCQTDLFSCKVIVYIMLLANI